MTEKQEQYELARDSVEQDLSENLRSMREAHEPNDFMTGYAYALQSIALRNINATLGSLKRALEGENLVPDMLAIFSLQGDIVRVAYELRGATPPKELIEDLQKAEEKFMSVYSKHEFIKQAIERLMKKDKGETE